MQLFMRLKTCDSGTKQRFYLEIHTRLTALRPLHCGGITFKVANTFLYSGLYYSVALLLPLLPFIIGQKHAFKRNAVFVVKRESLPYDNCERQYRE